MMKLLDNNSFLQLLRDRSEEVRLTGAGLARVLNVSRAQGSNILSGRSGTSVGNMQLWARAVGINIRTLAFDPEEEAQTMRLIQAISDFHGLALTRLGIMLGDDLDIFVRASKLPRARLNLLREFLFVLQHCSEGDLKVWQYQLAAHVDALDERMTTVGKQDASDNGSR
jgi:transcriptional regulator with XRE-family HTH domain